MALTYKNIFSQVGSMLNALSTYFDATTDDPAYSEYQIADAILAAEGKICETIAKTPGHRRRGSFITTQDITTNPGVVNSSPGDVIEVRIKDTNGGSYYTAEACPAQIVSRFAISTNPLSLTLINGLYSLQDNVLWFTGHTARVVYLNFTKPTSPVDGSTLTTLLSQTPTLPEEYFYDCCNLAMSILLGKEGAMTQAASYYAQLGMSVLEAIKSNSAPLTTFQAISEGR